MLSVIPFFNIIPRWNINPYVVPFHLDRLHYVSVLFGSLCNLCFVFSGVSYYDIWTGAFDSTCSESLGSAAKDRGDAIEIGTSKILCKTLFYIYHRFVIKCWIILRTASSLINLLKPTGYVMHQQFNIQQLYVLPTLYLCVLYLSENKQRLVPLAA